MKSPEGHCLQLVVSALYFSDLLSLNKPSDALSHPGGNLSCSLVSAFSAQLLQFTPGCKCTAYYLGSVFNIHTN